MDQSIIAPVRGKKIKKKRDKLRILSTIFIISFLVFSSVYISYWYFAKYPGIQEEREQEAIILNQTLRLQGVQMAINNLLNTSLNCNPTSIFYNNNLTGQNESITLFPFECLSNDEQLCLLKNGPQ